MVQRGYQGETVVYKAGQDRRRHQTLSCLCHTNMRILSIILLAVVLLVGLVAGRPNEIIDVDYDDHFEHEQEGVAGQAVHGKYEAYDAHGNEYEVKYVADHHGFRVVD